ncbi:spindle pole body associated protein [Encephalitozoon romaleae SJ-2008]|uniref:Spindle pole body associated protein n=1 Tax=Encephalitozoon romaleae (strain SJ-2008) TaxID=1178016 RepID=I7AQJ8_ENCRO|nr:spindle pole body associated protein [Encephalitozoon romaleae SJ-2008]AFN84129.1 spindle pole body associated protein [Encephalitozoon romaleae SJ-2008]
MNRRDRLQVKRSPDSTLNFGIDETIMLQTPTPKMRATKSVEPVEAHKYGQGGKGVKVYPVYVAIGILYVILFYIAITRPMNSMIIMNLMEEISILREENSRMSKQIESMGYTKEVNYAKVEEGARIRIENVSQLFPYGLLGFRKYKDPATIFDENVSVGECLSFKGCNCKFFIDFDKEITIDRVGFYHPRTKDTSSAIHEFEVFCYGSNGRLSLGEFKYDVDACGFQTFELEKVKTNSIEFAIRSNGGNKKFTCIYKVYLFGNK